MYVPGSVGVNAYVTISSAPQDSRVIGPGIPPVAFTECPGKTIEVHWLKGNSLVSVMVTGISSVRIRVGPGYWGTSAGLAPGA